jgi:hypothetical protein
MALRKSLILRRLRSGLEGRTTLIQPDFDFFTRSFAGTTESPTLPNRLVKSLVV